MGREIRQVPANWEHPRQECPHKPRCGGMCYQPMNDKDFDTALAEWLAEYESWKQGTHEWAQKYPDEPFWEWIGGPPQPEYYRPKWDSAEWHQIYETVSEGTPVTPPFATKEELVDYLVQHGDFWDQHRGDGGWSRVAAEQFVEQEWAPSLMVFRSSDEIIIKAPRDGLID